MQRKRFLLTALCAAPFLSLAGSVMRTLTSKNPFKVDAGKSRFNEKLTFKGINLQDIKVSGQDTGNSLTVLEYTGNEMAGPPLHIHFNEDEIFYIIEGVYRFVAGDDRACRRYRLFAA